jgi:hypothetical protein
MVSLWSELGGEQVAASNGDESYSPSADDANTTIGDEIPDWMLAAVAGAGGDDLSDPDAVPRPMSLPDEGDEETL